MSRMNGRVRTLLFGVWLASISTFSGNIEAGGDELVVVVNSSNSVARLSKTELRRIFQTTKSSWDDGTDIIPVNLPEGNELRQAFDKVVLGLDKNEVVKYWTDRRIRGGARPPRKALNSNAVAKFVTEEMGAVGYVKATEVTKGLRRVATIRGGEVL